MKKKRTKAYRPRVQRTNPLAFALESLHTVASHKTELLNLKLKNHAAMLALTRGVATREHITTLVCVSNMCEALVRFGFGLYYEQVATEGREALLAVARRGAPTNRYIVTAQEMLRLNNLMDLHDEQMEVIKIGDMDKALALVHKDMQLKKSEKIEGV